MTNNNMVTTICYKVKTPVTYKSGRTVETFLACYSNPEIAEQRVKELNEDKVKATWNFVNKLWNASRYVLMSLEDFKSEDYTLDNLTLSDKWIISKLNKLIKKVRNHMEKYEFNVVGTEIYNFIWNDFCDWYIELSKKNMNNTSKSVLLKVLTDILKLLHPFMPYVTEEIYLMLPMHDASIMISNYPVYNKDEVYTKEDCDYFMTEFNGTFYIFPVLGTLETKLWLSKTTLKTQKKAEDYLAEKVLQEL